jgi:UDP-N-acetyl-D-glucosamine dehydrogenase
MNSLITKIEDKTARVGVAGLGYVGLSLAVEFAKGGFQVLGVDISQERIDQILRGKSYIHDVKSEDITHLVQSGRLKVSSSYDLLRDADTISICVPTPLRKTKDPDTSHIRLAIAEIKRIFHTPLLIVLESTTYPGTTRELIINEIEALGYKVGKDFYVAFSPERVDPGNLNFKTRNTPKVIGGATKRCTEIARKLYDSVIEKVVVVNSTEEAEMIKLLENTFRSVNIALVNEMAQMCDRMSIDIWNVIGGAKTKPFGFMPFYPGPGIGGHCIPLDPMYLSWKAKTYDFYNRFIELATDINGNMPHFVVSKLSRILNERKKPLNGSKILILGIAYKKDTDDIRESPGLEIYRLIKQEKCSVDYNDPYVRSFEEGGKTIHSKRISAQMLKKYNCVVASTNHSYYDYLFIAKHATLIFDTRNAFKGIKSKKIVRL